MTTLTVSDAPSLLKAIAAATAEPVVVTVAPGEYVGKVYGAPGTKEVVEVTVLNGVQLTIQSAAAPVLTVPPAPTYQAHDGPSLKAAVKVAAAGAVINLAPGTYTGDTIAMSGQHYPGVFLSGYDFATPVTIQGCPGAIFPGLGMTGIGLTVQGVEIDTPPVGTGTAYPYQTQCFVQIGGSNNQFRDSVIKGPAGNTLAAQAGSGIMTRNAADVVIDGVEFVGLHYGVMPVTTNGVTITNNFYHDCYDDFVQASGCSNVDVSGNRLQNLHQDLTDTDHPDSCQVSPSAAADNWTIQDNLFLRGAKGQPAQGFPFCQPAPAVTGQPQTYHKGFKVLDNIMAGCFANGVTLAACDSPVIDGNILQADPREVVTGTLQVVEPKILLDACLNVTLTNNQSAGLVKDPWLGKTLPTTFAVDSGNTTVTAPYADGGAALLALWLGRSARKFSSSAL